MRYKPSKANIVLDILLRFTSRLYRPKIDELILDVFTTFLVNIIAVSEDFKSNIYSSYEVEGRWVRIITTIVKNTVLGENTAKLLYKLINGLLYFDDIEYNYSLRLYLLAALEYKVF